VIYRNITGRGKIAIMGAAISLSLLFLLSLSGCGRPVRKEGEVMVWHWMTDRHEAFEELARQYQEKTGISVKFELFAPSDVYSSKVRAAAQTDTLPDIFGVLAETRDFASFIKAGFVADLTGEMNRGGWEKSFFPKALDINRFDADNEYGVKPGIYGIPIDVMNIQMIYNKRLFEKAGLDPEMPPQTWDEFLAAGEKLKAKGIQVLISGFGETWLLDCLASNFSWNLMGRDKVIDTIKGEVSYTDPDWLTVFRLFQTIHKKDLLAIGAVTMVNKVAEQNFANERAAIAFNGSWCVNVYDSMNPKLDYGIMPPPKISDKFPRAIWGGSGSSFMVNERSPAKQDAVKFLRWLTDTQQQIFLSEKTRNLPSNKYSAAKIPEELRQFADDMDLVVHPRQLPVNEFSRVVEALSKGLQSILIGEKTPEQIAKYVQSVKERELKRAAQRKR